MPKYQIHLQGYRTSLPDSQMRGELTLKINAPTIEQADEIVKDSLPGFDWKWVSQVGLVDMSWVEERKTWSEKV